MPNPYYNYHHEVPEYITKHLIEKISEYQGQFNDPFTRSRVIQDVEEYQIELLHTIGYKLDLGLQFDKDGIVLTPLPQDIHILPRLIIIDGSWVMRSIR